MTSLVTWVYIQSEISMQCFNIFSLGLLLRVTAMSIFQNKKYDITRGGSRHVGGGLNQS